jgi:hypothetical protein
MPKINNPKGTAIINSGFITPSSVLGLEDACGYSKREGGSRLGNHSAPKEPKFMPPHTWWPGLLPLARH